MSGFKLDFANADPRDTTDEKDRDDALGRELTVEFLLPDGSKHQDNFREGHPVAHLKVGLETALELPVDNYVSLSRVYPISFRSSFIYVTITPNYIS